MYPALISFYFTSYSNIYFGSSALTLRQNSDLKLFIMGKVDFSNTYNLFLIVSSLSSSLLFLIPLLMSLFVRADWSQEKYNKFLNSSSLLIISFHFYIFYLFLGKPSRRTVLLSSYVLIFLRISSITNSLDTIFPSFMIARNSLEC